MPMNTTAAPAIARYDADGHTIGYVTLKSGETRRAVSGPNRTTDGTESTYLYAYDARGRVLRIGAQVAASYVVVGPQVNDYDYAADWAEAIAEDAARTTAADAELDTAVIAGNLRAAYELTLNDDADIARQYDAVRGVILRAAHDAAIDEDHAEHRRTRYYNLKDIAVLAGVGDDSVGDVLLALNPTELPQPGRGHYPQALVRYVMPILKAQLRNGWIDAR